MTTLNRRLVVVGLTSWLMAGTQIRGDQRIMPPAVEEPMDQHVAWLVKVFQQIQTVKAGTRRADLLKVLTPDGGLSIRTQQTFHYPGCPYIHVDVTFKPSSTDVGDKGHEISGSGEDTVIEISRPYIGWATLD